MSKARKCDRCGKCFDPIRFGDKTMMARFQNPVFQNSEQIKDHDVGYYLIEDTADTYVDLCPDCTKDFEAFMDGNPLKMKEADFDKPDICDSLSLIGGTTVKPEDYNKYAFLWSHSESLSRSD